MSTMMRPAGPLPPKVYWVRRLMIVFVVVVLTGLVWWLVSGFGRADESQADRPAPGATTTSSAATPGATTKPSPEPTPTGTASTTRARTPRPEPTRTADEQTTPTKRPPLAEPTGACKPTDIDIEIDVSDTSPGEPATATLLLTSTEAVACTLAITPTSMFVRITSGDDVVWSSDDCPDALRAKEVVARADPPTAYEFRWSGLRSSDNCQPVDTLPEPGGYWVEGALIGGEPHRAYFDILAAKS